MGGSPINYSADTPYGNYTFNVPSFSSIMGASPTDLLNQLAALKSNQARENYGYQSGLLGQQLREQGNEAGMVNNQVLTRLANELSLGQGQLGLQRDLGMGQLDLSRSQLGEQGRQFDVGTQFNRDSEANRYRYLDELLNFQKAQDAADRAYRDRALAQSVIDQRRNNGGGWGGGWNGGFQWDATSGIIPRQGNAWEAFRMGNPVNTGIISVTRPKEAVYAR